MSRRNWLISAVLVLLCGGVMALFTDVEIPALRWLRCSFSGSLRNSSPASSSNHSPSSPTHSPSSPDHSSFSFSTGSHTAAEYVTYGDMALEFELAASRGSDFHSQDESHTDLGSLPYLPGKLTPVWELLADRIQ